MKIISYFFLGIEYILCKILSYICVFPLKKKGKGIKKRASAFFYLLFCEKKNNIRQYGEYKRIFWDILVFYNNIYTYKNEKIWDIGYFASGLALLVKLS